MLRAALTAAATVLVGGTAAHADWTTYHADRALSGVDRSSGSPRPFAESWKVAGLAGTVWAEPLVFHGLVIVATEDNDLYAFHETTGAQAWHTHLGAPVPASELPCGDIDPTVGITSTPVIDPATGTLYAVAALANGTSATHTLVAVHALTGTRIFSRNVEPPSDPLNQLQRESLALDHGRVLIGYGGNDGDCAQYRGYLVSAPANNSGSNFIYAVPTSREGAIWSGGGAPAVDAAGDVFVPTGNAANGPGEPFDHGDTLEKLSPLASELDYWAPSSWAQDSAADADLGSVSPELLPGNLIYQGGKNGNGYLISATHLGHVGGELFGAPVCDSFGADAYANDILYVACAQGIRALNIDVTGRRFSQRWSGPGDADGPPIIAGGLVWVTSTGDSLLYGLDASSGAVKVTRSTPSMEHFVTPAASDGRLFLATGSTLNTYTIAAPTRANRSSCHNRVTIRLRVPRHRHIVAVTVRVGHRVTLRRQGSRLTSVTLVNLSQGSVTLHITETPNRGRRITLTIRVRDCRRVGA